jgi:hypothetical protein
LTQPPAARGRDIFPKQSSATIRFNGADTGMGLFEHFAVNDICDVVVQGNDVDLFLTRVPATPQVVLARWARPARPETGARSVTMP